MIFYARPAQVRAGKDIPAEELKVHLFNVAKRAKDSLALATLPNSKLLSDWAELCGLTHDFGKYTSYFQNKLPPKNINPPKQAYGNHAFISALLGAYVAKLRYNSNPIPALLVYLAIHRHHGHLVTPTEILPRDKYLKDAPTFKAINGVYRSRVKSEHLRAVYAQLEDLRRGNYYKQIIQEMDSLGIPEVKSFLEQDSWRQLISELRRSHKELLRNSTAALYWQATLLFSALIDSDKQISAVAGLGKDADVLERLEIPTHLVDDFIKTLQKPKKVSVMQQRLFDIRRDVYSEATQTTMIKELRALYPAVLSLTAPTGSGKTLTALGIAFRLRERVYKKFGTFPRIIYALPFVNIIDQNYEVTKNVLAQLKDFKEKESHYILKHHYLASPAFKENEDYSNDEALLLTESWESEIIVTTFVQLFQSLITNKNRALKKLHNIAGSIIILDEIQSIPYEQWRLVEYVLTTITEYLGCTVLQMTATSPHIFKEKKAYELLVQPERYFKGLARTKLVPKKDICNIEQLKGFVNEKKTHKISMLVVVNTIHSAVELYKILKLKDSDKKAYAPYKEFGRKKIKSCCPIVHLSTNITPWQRRQRVRLLRRYMAKGGKPLVISTQVVEAGVDLDFDVVIRDQGPLDSIVQVAGRCNRNGSKDGSSEVYVVNIERDNGKSEASLVYGAILPEISNRRLTRVIEEPELYATIDKYFDAMTGRLSEDESYEFINAINKLYFQAKDDSRSVSQYSLIETYEQEPVIVALSRNAKMAIKHLEQLYKYGGDKHAFKEAYRKLGPYVITPSKYRISKNPPHKRTIEETIADYYHVHSGDIYANEPRYYDLETGYIWQDETVIL